MCKEIISAKITTIASALKNNLQGVADKILGCLYSCFKADFIKWGRIAYKNYPEETLEFITDKAFTDCIFKFKDVATNQGLYDDGNTTIKTVVFNFYKNKLREGLQTENRLVAKKQRLQLDGATILADTENEVGKENLYRLVELAIEKMDATDRQIIMWRHIQEKPNEEIAQLLGISTPSATNRIYRCMQRLRDLTENNV